MLRSQVTPSALLVGAVAVGDLEDLGVRHVGDLRHNE